MTHYVPGSGPWPAKGMIVGEAPGRTEVQLGRPFVGPSGILLDQALVALAVPRETIYITNVVKFLPLTPDGKIRPPTDKEMDEGASKLLSEIRMVKPDSILALGRTAEKFLNDRGISNVYAWHPAYVLRRHGGLSTEWLEQIRPWAKEVR